MTYRLTDTHIVLPGLTSAHSHAFQRALRGHTQRKAMRSGSFWSWRDLMFRLVEQLTPERVFALSHYAFVELAMSGVTSVGEFHYVHHDRGGAPYADRLAMTDAVLRAAHDAGIRITLIRTGYYRAGYGQTLSAGQQRFCDRDADETLRDLEASTALIARMPHARLALAAHSLRACAAPQIRQLAAYADSHRLPFHMHVSEQAREVEECVAEYGNRPVEFLAELGILNQRFTGIHVTHLTANEVRMYGQSRSMACICRSTERDLGDGLPLSADLIAAGARICVGADSHAGPDAFEDIRAVELDDRVRVQKRIVAAEADGLLAIGTTNGLESIGQADAQGQDEVHLRRADAAFAGLSEERALDAALFVATPRSIDKVLVAGRPIVVDGVHLGYDAARRGFERALGDMAREASL